FGESFEKWARAAARRARESKKFNARLDVSARLGGDELEDVVLYNAPRVALISAKARVMPGDMARGTGSAAAAVRWYESMLFDAARGDQRGGALRLIERGVRRIRDGSASGVPIDTRIYPVLL